MSNREALQRVLERVNSACEAEEGFQHGLGKLTFADEYTPGEVKLWIPSGINLIDLPLGGGLPCGRVVEIFSEDESEGKTTIALHFMAQLQRFARGGGLGLWLEQETALDKDRAAEGLGVDTASLFMDGPHSVEDGFIRIWKWLDETCAVDEFKAQPKLIVWDTIAAAPPRAEAAGQMYADGMTSKPRAISAALRGLVQRLYKANATLLMLNQSYTNIRSKLPFPVYEQPGGKGLKFYSSIRLRLKRIGYTAESKTVKSGKAGKNTKTGIIVEMETVKNKTAPPFRSAHLALAGYRGYNNPLTYAHHFADLKRDDLIKPKGAYYQLAGAGKNVTWSQIEELETSSEWPAIQGSFWGASLEMFPLPPDRRLNPETGWIEKIDGVDQFLSFGDGERPMTEEEIARASEKVTKPKPRKKSGKKVRGKKKS